MSSGGMSILSATRYTEATDIKGLIADAGTRRRMSRLIKMGVATGMDCLAKGGICRPDAIVCATGYGFLSDSEKLLGQMVSAGEEMMSPTPFMQSTFNSIGSSIAIMTGCQGANMTFADGWRSVGAALVFCQMLITSGEAETVLLVAGDELTPTLRTIVDRMGRARHGIAAGEGVAAVLMGREGGIGTIEEISPTTERWPIEKSDWAFPTASAMRLLDAIERKETTTYETAGAKCRIGF